MTKTVKVIELDIKDVCHATQDQLISQQQAQYLEQYIEKNPIIVNISVQEIAQHEKELLLHAFEQTLTQELSKIFKGENKGKQRSHEPDNPEGQEINNNIPNINITTEQLRKHNDTRLEQDDISRDNEDENNISPPKTQKTSTKAKENKNNSQKQTNNKCIKQQAAMIAKQMTQALSENLGGNTSSKKQQTQIQIALTNKQTKDKDQDKRLRK